MRYTDDAGDYLSPRTGATRSKGPAEHEEGMSVAQPRAPHAPGTRGWPEGAARDIKAAPDLGFLVGAPVADVSHDHDGLRLVVERGDRPEPAVYVDPWFPEHGASERRPGAPPQQP